MRQDELQVEHLRRCCSIGYGSQRLTRIMNNDRGMTWSLQYLAKSEETVANFNQPTILSLQRLDVCTQSGRRLSDALPHKSDLQDDQ